MTVHVDTVRKHGSSVSVRSWRPVLGIESVQVCVLSACMTYDSSEFLTQLMRYIYRTLDAKVTTWDVAIVWKQRTPLSFGVKDELCWIKPKSCSLLNRLSIVVFLLRGHGSLRIRSIMPWFVFNAEIETLQTCIDSSSLNLEENWFTFLLKRREKKE